MEKEKLKEREENDTEEFKQVQENSKKIEKEKKKMTESKKKQSCIPKARCSSLQAQVPEKQEF